MEPVFLVEIQGPQSIVGSVYSVLQKRRGKIIEEIPRPGTPLTTLKCHLPVAESFGFNNDLKARTAGEAFPQCVFDHWQVIQSDPLEKGAKILEIISATRKRKGLPVDIPPLDRFLDKL
jgi:elongation factor 2